MQYYRNVLSNLLQFFSSSSFCFSFNIKNFITQSNPFFILRKRYNGGLVTLVTSRATSSFLLTFVTFCLTSKSQQPPELLNAPVFHPSDVSDYCRMIVPNPAHHVACIATQQGFYNKNNTIVVKVANHEEG